MRKRAELWPSTEQRVWIFDLDNTLYPRSARLFDQIDRLMTAFISDTLGVPDAQADGIRRDTWTRYGATLTGLMVEHDVDADAFLEATHRIDLEHLTPDPRLIRALGALPGPRIIHTNGPRAHADRVLEARGLVGLFDRIVALEDTGLVAKPDAASTRALLDITGIDPVEAVMIEDQEPNLAEPHRLGMKTVWLTEEVSDPPGHVDLRIEDLAAFLEEVTARASAG